MGRAVYGFGQSLIQDFVDQRRLARPRYARHDGQGADGNRYVDVLQVVLRRADDFDIRPVAWRRSSGIGIYFAPFKYCPVRDCSQAIISSAVPWATISPPVLSRRRADVQYIIGGPHRILVMLDDDERIAQVAEVLQGLKQLVVVPLMKADRRLVEDV